MLMIKQCKRCGKPVVGRVDKVFCSDECRNDYHNEIRRAEEKRIRAVNRILKHNRFVLDRCFNAGRTRIGMSELKSMFYDFDNYTRVLRRFLRKPVFCCYDYCYTISIFRTVHIMRSRKRNIDYIWSLNQDSNISSDEK